MPVEEDIFSDLYDSIAFKMNPPHVDTDHKHKQRLRKCIKVFSVDGGKLYGEKCKGSSAS